MKIVVKIGGAALENKETLRKCAHAVVELVRDGHKVTVVHGGGSTLTRTLELMGKHSLDFWLTSEDLPDPERPSS